VGIGTAEETARVSCSSPECPPEREQDYRNQEDHPEAHGPTCGERDHGPSLPRPQGGIQPEFPPANPVPSGLKSKKGASPASPTPISLTYRDTYRDRSFIQLGLRKPVGGLWGNLGLPSGKGNARLSRLKDGIRVLMNSATRERFLPGPESRIENPESIPRFRERGLGVRSCGAWLRVWIAGRPATEC